MLEETIDYSLNAIDESINKKKNYDVDVNQNFPERFTYSESSGEIKKHIEMGNGVEETGVVAKIKQPLYKDVLSGLFSSIGTASTEVGKTLDNINDNLGGVVYHNPTFILNAVINDQIKKSKPGKILQNFYNEKFTPKTERAKIISDVAAEIELFVANNVALKKLKWFSKGVSYLPKATKKYAEQLFRWSTAEGVARGTMGEDEESITLMLTDLAGLTDKNDMEDIRQFYKSNLEQKTPESEMKIRLANFLDGFALGSTADVFIKLLMTNYGKILATGGVGLINIQDQDAENKQSIYLDNEQHKNLIQEIQENPFLLD